MTVTGTTAALVVAAIGVAVTALVAPFVSARLQRRNARHAAHEPAVAAARLIQREMEAIHAAAERAQDQGLEHVSFPSSEWDKHKAAAAARLTPEELLVLDGFYQWVKVGAVPAIPVFFPMASQAISWLVRGDVDSITPRRTETSLAPLDMDLPCRCGHPFGHHGWRATRRRVRFTRRDAKYKDVGFECHRCECRKFRGVGRLHYI